MTSWKYEVAAYAQSLFYEIQHGGIFSSCVLFEPWIRYPLDHLDHPEMYFNINREHFNKIRLGGPFWESMPELFGKLPTGEEIYRGRLASAIVGGGKRHLFVIGNYVKQCLLKPYHDWAMTVLRCIPNDGTFDQAAPLKYVRGGKDVSSYDLSSATDRFPSIMFFHTMADMFGEEIASATVVAGLSSSRFDIKPPLMKGHYQHVKFAVGQPLGYYLSWSLFSLAHHKVVWWAALRAYPRQDSTFSRYAILGDDVVIADSRVAREYHLILKGLKVEISAKKSLLSARGGLEFAKKFMCWGAGKDLSPVSLPSLVTLNTCSGIRVFQQKYPHASEGLLFRLSGAGYKVLGRLSSPSLKSRMWERLRIFLSAPLHSSPSDFEWWLGGYMPLNPYLKGQLWWWLVDATRPKDPRVPVGNKDDEVNELELEFLERTCLVQWVDLWLRALKQHTVLSSNMETPFQDFLNLPVVESQPYRRTSDPTVQRFGLIWKLYTKVRRSKSVPLAIEGKGESSEEDGN